MRPSQVELSLERLKLEEEKEEYSGGIEEGEGISVEELLSYLDSDEEEAIANTKRDPHVWIRYWQQMKQSEGYEIHDYPGLCAAASITPLFNITEDEREVKLLMQLSSWALRKFNREQETRYEVDKIVRANSGVAAGIRYYITFEAKNLDTDAVETFEARVFDGVEVLNVEQIRIKGKK